MASNISSLINTRLRLSGLSSGIDTESMIQKLMKAEMMRVDKVKQDRQLLEWKRDSYREIISSLKGFYSSYFDVLSPTNLTSPSAFSAYKTTYNGADTSPYIKISAGANVLSGNYAVKNIVTAKVAQTASAALSSASGGITGEYIANASISSISSANDNNKINVTFNGSSKVITLSDGLADISGLAAELQSKLNEAFGTGKITVGTVGTDINGGQLTFTTDSTNSLSFGYAYNGGASVLFGPNLSAGITLDAQNNKFKVALGSETREITMTARTYTNTDDIIGEMQSRIDAAGFTEGTIRVVNRNNTIVLKVVGIAGTISGIGTDPDDGTPWDWSYKDISDAANPGGIKVGATNQNIDVTIDSTTHTITLDQKTYNEAELISAIQSKVDAAFGAGKGVVSMDLATGQLRVESGLPTPTVSQSAKENLGLSAAGLANVNPSNKIDLSSTLDKIVNRFSGGILQPGTSPGSDIQFSINGVTFTFDSAKDSLNSIMAAVNANTDAGVKMSYDELNDRIIVRSTAYGAAAKVEIADVDAATKGNLMTVLGLSGVNQAGTDASIYFSSDGGATYQTIVRSSNNFAINGMNFSLAGDSTETINITIGSDPSRTYDLIKGFVDKYNEVLDLINKKLSEKRYRDYRPLTDDQKEAMNENDIKKWEDKAKSGLLNSDGLLQRLVYDMRNALYSQVSGVSLTLSTIGITTGSYQDKGKLVIDETKLKDAIARNPDEVTKLFAQDSRYSYYEALDDSAKRSIRNSETGLAQKLKDILDDNIRTMRNSQGKKGLLIEKAGLAGDVSEFSNTITKDIESYNNRIDDLIEMLNRKEDYYYKKFTAMETALSNMNAQMAWLSQQLGK